MCQQTTAAPRVEQIQRVLPQFSCRWSASSGAKQMHELFRRIDMTEAEFRAPPYTRLAMLMKHRKAGLLDDKLFWTFP